MGIEFIKMHGLGNDFVIFDGRSHNLSCLNSSYIAELADRKIGIGCDQLIILENSDIADAFMRIYNPDGTEAEACGNAMRCVGKLLCQTLDKQEITIDTVVGIKTVKIEDDGRYTANMGKPKWGWQDIPLSEEQDTLNLTLPLNKGVQQAVAVSMGNPHVVFFVDNVEDIPLEDWGPAIENHAIFPNKTNVEFVEVKSPTELRMRVWERGTGVTRSCGSGSCAALVAAVRAGKATRRADIVLDGGSLLIEWDLDTGDVFMTGSAVEVFTGIVYIDSKYSHLT